jgi:hypothetical protein
LTFAFEESPHQSRFWKKTAGAAWPVLPLGCQMQADADRHFMLLKK